MSIYKLPGRACKALHGPALMKPQCHSLLFVVCSPTLSHTSTQCTISSICTKYFLLAPETLPWKSSRVLFCVPGIPFLLVHTGLWISLATPPSPKSLSNSTRLESDDFLYILNHVIALTTLAPRCFPICQSHH